MLRAATAIFSLSACTGAVWAQTAPPLGENTASDGVSRYFSSDVAGNRRQPEFDPVALHIGVFTVSPQIQGNVSYDGNAVNRSDDFGLYTGVAMELGSLAASYGQLLPPAVIHEIGQLNANPQQLRSVLNPQLARRWDTIFDIDPQISANADWNGNSLSIDAGGRIYRYARLTRENRDEWHANAVGVIALGEKQSITLTGGADSRAEVPGSNGTALLDYFGFGPSIKTTPTASASANLVFGRVEGTATVAFTRDNYSRLDLRTADLLAPVALAASGLPGQLAISQAFRDRQTIAAIGNLTYDVSSETQIFVQTALQNIQQVHPTIDQRGRPVRAFDSDTYGFLVGVAKSFSSLIIVQGGIGWQYHGYADRVYQNTSRLNVQGAADWYPSPLLSFRITADQNYMGSAVPGVGDLSVRTLTLRGDYEFRPNIEVWTLISNEWDKYPAGATPLNIGIAGGSTTILQAAKFEVDYRPDRNLEIGINIGLHRRLAVNSVVLGGFTALRAGLSLTLRH